MTSEVVRKKPTQNNVEFDCGNRQLTKVAFNYVVLEEIFVVWLY